MSNPLSKVFHGVEHYFSTIDIFVDKEVQLIFGSDAAHRFYAAALSLLETALGQIAKAAVLEAEAMIGASGTDKHAFAFGKIVTDAKNAAITAEPVVVNMLIELALQAIRGFFSPTKAAQYTPPDVIAGS